MEPKVGFEPTTYGLQNRRSNQLSYFGIYVKPANIYFDLFNNNYSKQINNAKSLTKIVKIVNSLYASTTYGTPWSILGLRIGWVNEDLKICEAF